MIIVEKQDGNEWVKICERPTESLKETRQLIHLYGRLGGYRVRRDKLVVEEPQNES